MRQALVTHSHRRSRWASAGWHGRRTARQGLRASGGPDSRRTARHAVRPGVENRLRDVHTTRGYYRSPLSQRLLPFPPRSSVPSRTAALPRRVVLWLHAVCPQGVKRQHHTLAIMASPASCCNRRSQTSETTPVRNIRTFHTQNTPSCSLTNMRRILHYSTDLRAHARSLRQLALKYHLSHSCLAL